MMQGRYPIGFYSLIIALNILAASMFRVVMTPPPVQAIVQQNLTRPSKPQQVTAVTGTPNRLVINSLGMDLPIDVGAYDPTSGEWTTADDRAFFADNSVPANDSNGVTLIYGHARWGVFGSLPDLKPGATADLYTSNGRVFHYQYKSVREVVPTDTSVFTVYGPPTLMLQTCTGAWDMYRAMYSFSYVGEEGL